MIAILILGSISAAGVLFALALFILGYAKHMRFFLILGALFLPIYLLFYYYNLDVTLLYKSLILILSGILLLLSRSYLKFRKWDV